MKQGVLILLVGVVFAAQLLSATRTTCGDSLFSHRCSLLNWNSNCTNDLNLTLNYSHLYHGDRSTITTSYDDGENETLTYFICLRRYIPGLNKFYYKKIACVETNDSAVNVLWRWSFHSNATVLANVFTYDNFLDIPPLACAMRNITVGRRRPLNISVLITEEGHDEQYLQFVPGNISIIVSADLSNSTNHSSNTSSTVMYSYSLLLLDLETENFTHQRYEVSNDSSLEFVFEFTDPGGYSYDVSMTANDSTNSILYSSDPFFDDLFIVEPVGYPAITVNRNQTASRGSSVDVVIAVDNASLPITVCWNLTVPPSEIPLNNHSDPNSHNKPSQPILTPYHYRCNSTINCTTFNLNSTYQFIFNCTFNSTGNYQLMALFNNSASAGKVLYNFSVSEPPTPPVVATSTSAVVAIVVIVIGVVILLAIALYIPYYRYRNRFTETANFSFVRLRRPSKWDHFKSQVDQLKDRVLRRQSKVGLVNVNDDPLTSSYGSIDHFDTHESL